MLKRISLKGLADYMTASHVRQRSILKHFKYPDEDEAQAKRVYYKEARDGIAVFHRARKGVPWIVGHSTSIDAMAATREGRARARLEHNARALRAYANHFSGRHFEVLRTIKLILQYDDLLISVVPDLTVEEGGHTKLVKFEFGEEEPSREMVKVLAQGLFEAAEQGGLGLPASAVLLLDVRRGREHRGARLGARMRSEIQAASRTISAVWDTI